MKITAGTVPTARKEDSFMDVLYKVETGIDSFSYSCSLTSKQKRTMLESMKSLSKFQTRCADYENESFDYTCDHFAAKGIKLRVFQRKGSIWTCFITVHPTLLMGDTNRSALYHPNKNIFKSLMSSANSILEQIQCPCRIEAMKLYRVDVTANIIFDDADLVISLKPSDNSPYDIAEDSVLRIRMSIYPTPKMGDFSATHEKTSYFDVLYLPSQAFSCTRLCRLIREFLIS